MTRLTVPEAAQYLRLAKSTLDHYRSAGQGPRFIKLSRRKILYDTRDLDAWLNHHKQSSTSDRPQLRRRRRRSKSVISAFD
jgi:predicted DNA-binding transcriptional regulator AlpA